MNQKKARRVRKLAEELYNSNYDTTSMKGQINHKHTRFKRLYRQLKKIAVTGAPARNFIRIMPG